MDTQSALKVEISMAWWLGIYKYGVIAACMLTGCDMDSAKVQKWCNRAVRVKINGKRVKV